MIEIDVLQGSEEWHKARTGIPTASHFSKIITPKTLKLSAESDHYENRLVAERLTGCPCDDFKGSYWIERGKELEGDAVAFLEMSLGVSVRHCGLLLNDKKTFGASPDGILDADKGLELKCPKQETHVGYLLNPEMLYNDYKPQVQGGLFVSGFKSWEIVSFHPDLPPARYEVKPDGAYHDALASALETMESNIEKKISIIKEM